MKSRKVYRWLLRMFLIALMGAILTVFGITFLRLWDTFGVKYPSLDYIANYTEITFPKSSQLVRSYSLGGTDRSINAVVKIKRSDVSRFISDLHKTTLCEEYKENNARLFTSKPRHPKSGDTRCQIRIRESDPHYASISLDGLLF